MNIQTKHYTFEGLTRDLSDLQSRSQLNLLYRLAREFQNVNILELGTQSGVSATVFLQACHENDGFLTSVDIEDCSDISSDHRFQFVQSDSTDALSIVKSAPQLKNGIDILYVDTIHKVKHVENELRAWWPWMKEGSVIIFDDIDPHVYRPKQQKDSIGVEISNEQIGSFVEAIFRSNMDKLELSFVYGSSGKAVLRKHTPLGEKLGQIRSIRKRSIFLRVLRKLRTRDFD